MRLLMVAAAALLIGPSTVQAQGPEALAEGRTSIAFAIPQSGSTSFGIWKQLSPTRALGLQGSVLYGRHESEFANHESTQFQISVAPAMKWYRSLTPTVAPFLRGSVGVGYNRSEQLSGDIRIETDGFNVNASAGIGVDWFPLRSISIGGFTGLSGALGRVDSGTERNSLTLGTTTSALTMHIYF